MYQALISLLIASFCLIAAQSDDAIKQSQTHFELALAACREQQIDVAFCHFLDSLQMIESPSSSPIDPNEEVIYKQALDDYLNSSGIDPARLAKELIERYEQRAVENPDYFHLNCLMAISYANLGKYLIFFERFYRAYPHIQNCFLADKAQGILYLKLLQRAYLPDKRASFQQKALFFLEQALEKCSTDAGLYRTLVFLAKERKNQEMVGLLLQKMVDHQVKMARTDIYFYVEEAVAMKEYQLAQALIDQAKTFYNYSRAISDAQDFLNRYSASQVN